MNVKPVVSTACETTVYGAQPIEVERAVDLCLLSGQILFNFGASAQRIRDSVVFLGQYLGCAVDLLVSYDALLVTVSNGAHFQTRIDSSRRLIGQNLLGLIRVSKLLRSLPQSQSTPDAIEQALCAIRDAPPIHKLASQALASGCAGAAFCIVNGGDPASWIISFVAATFICVLRRPLGARGFNMHFTLFVIAAAGSLLAGLLAHVTATATPAIAVIASVLFLVPGVAVINGGVEIVHNHVTIGIARIGFALAVLVVLCLGVGSALPLLPLRTHPPIAWSAAWEVLALAAAAALAASALAYLSNGDAPLIALCALGGLTARLVCSLMAFSGLDLISTSLAGVACSTLLVSFIAERLRWPAAFASVIAALPMVPGYFAIEGMHSLLSFAAASTADPAELSTGVQVLSRALAVSVALVVGVVGPVTVLQHDREYV